MITLPSLRDLDRPRGDASVPAPRIWLAVCHADMRCGFDRLAELVASIVGRGARSGHLFLFRSHQPYWGGDRLKMLDWDRDAFARAWNETANGGCLHPMVRLAATQQR